MVKIQFLCLLLFLLCKQTLQDIDDNIIEDELPTPGDIKNDFLNEDTINNLGSVVNNFIQSDGGKQIGDILMGASNNNVIMSQILQGMGSSLMQQNTAKEDRGETGLPGGLNAELMGNLFNMMVNQQKPANTGGGGGSGFDIGGLLQMFMGMSGSGSPLGYMNLIPNILQTFASIVGPESQRKELEHADHAWMFPPFIEKLHVFFDNFVHSEMGAALMESTGANRAIRLFSDEDGNFSYPKFVEMFENHSFRKHWISMITKKIAAVISYFADPYTQKKFTTTFQLFINNFLKGQGVPKTALFDTTRPTESLTALANYVSKKYLGGQKIDGKIYIQPTVAYIQELLGMAAQRGIVGTGVDSEKLSHKIADTINLEIIEPVVRVNRAYRYASKVPKCDRYVLCLVNQKVADEVESIPGLKYSLSRLASFIASWFLSDHGNTSFWSLYHVVIEENNCQARYLDECHDFHVEEIKVTTEYIHNEL